MQKKSIKIVLCLSLVFIVGILSVLIYQLEKFDDFSIYIFSNISECEKFFKEESDVYMEIYEAPSKDENLSGLTYEKFFAGKYSSSELTFEIFAYEFENDSTAKQYFKNMTGRESESTSNFLGEEGLVEYSLVVISNEKAYSVYTETKNAKKLMEILENTFTNQIY